MRVEPEIVSVSGEVTRRSRQVQALRALAWRTLECENVAEVPLLDRAGHQLVVVDAAGDPDVLEGIDGFIAEHRFAKIILIADDPSGLHRTECVRPSVRALLPPDVSAEELKAAVLLVASGLTIGPGRNADEAAPAQPLSPREREVLEHLSTGAPNKVVANALALSENTVRIHVRAILRKLGVRNRGEAAEWVRRRGLP